MIFPKLAIHISPFKLSHLANRGHLQFQNLRNTFNNINLGSTVAPNAPSVGGSASGGLGAATGPSTAGGAGGAKWSAGSRAGWTQQVPSPTFSKGELSPDKFHHLSDSFVPWEHAFRANRDSSRKAIPPRQTIRILSKTRMMKRMNYRLTVY